MDCKAPTNKAKCPCKKVPDCERKGICCDCLRAHIAAKSLPACMRGLSWLEVKA